MRGSDVFTGHFNASETVVINVVRFGRRYFTSRISVELSTLPQFLVVVSAVGCLVLGISSWTLPRQACYHGSHFDKSHISALLLTITLDLILGRMLTFKTKLSTN